MSNLFFPDERPRANTLRVGTYCHPIHTGRLNKGSFRFFGRFCFGATGFGIGCDVLGSNVRTSDNRLGLVVRPRASRAIGISCIRGNRASVIFVCFRLRSRVTRRRVVLSNSCSTPRATYRSGTRVGSDRNETIMCCGNNELVFGYGANRLRDCGFGNGRLLGRVALNGSENFIPSICETPLSGSVCLGRV